MNAKSQGIKLNSRVIHENLSPSTRLSVDEIQIQNLNSATSNHKNAQKSLKISCDAVTKQL